MRAVLDMLLNGRSLLIAAAVSISVFALAVWLPNLQLLVIVWQDSATTVWDKIALPLTLLSSITTNFTPLSGTYTVVIAILAGINMALIVALIRARQMVARGAAAGGIGIFAGALGVGCAACGSLLLTALAGTTIGTGALALLPLGGSEFGVLGVGLLGYATYLLVRQLNKTTCDVTI